MDTYRALQLPEITLLKTLHDFCVCLIKYIFIDAEKQKEYLVLLCG